jgi:undecaprenyl diphosphate synthase
MTTREPAGPRLDLTRLPRHVAVIMDGNGRWARQRQRPRLRGHMAGVEAVRATVEGCAELKIPALTLYAFSGENWRRPQGEVNFLMRLLRRYLRSETEALRRQNIRLEAMGRVGELAEVVREDLQRARAATCDCTGMVLTLALNYGGRAEIVDACRQLIEDARAAGPGSGVEATEEALAARMYTAQLGDPDLLIRTSGEMRVSNFMLWQIAYAEIYVTPVLWPDFRKPDLWEALAAFQKRERRFGGLGQTPARRALRQGAARA